MARWGVAAAGVIAFAAVLCSSSPRKEEILSCHPTADLLSLICPDVNLPDWEIVCFEAADESSRERPRPRPRDVARRAVDQLAAQTIERPGDDEIRSRAIFWFDWCTKWRDRRVVDPH